MYIRLAHHHRLRRTRTRRGRRNRHGRPAPITTLAINDIHAMRAIVQRDAALELILAVVQPMRAAFAAAFAFDQEASTKTQSSINDLSRKGGVGGGGGGGLRLVDLGAGHPAGIFAPRADVDGGELAGGVGGVVVVVGGAVGGRGVGL